MDVDAVEQGTADAFLVAGDGHGGAATFFDRVAVVAARAGIHGSDEHEVGGVGDGSQGTGDGDDFVFERLAQDFEDVLAKFG